ncbi:MAG: cell wall-binding repeat-containing protein [Oscillospiraceae bacterium]|nr:cell wall-binding repeat-containing protein [Oscillospiraceae bacterium]
MKRRMRKLAGLLLALVMVLSLLPATAMASMDEISFGGVTLGDGQYLSEDSNTPTDTPLTDNYAYFEGGVLTLKNYDGALAMSGDYVYYSGDLAVNVLGENYLGNSSTSAGDIFDIYGDVSIYGNGSLEVYCANGQDDGFNVDGTVTLQDVTLFIDAYDDGIYAEGLVIKSGELYAWANYATYLDTPIVYPEGYAAANYYKDSANNYYLAPFENEPWSNYDKLVIAPVVDPIYVGGVELENGEYLEVGASAPTTSNPGDNYAHYYGGVLTLKNYTYTGVGSYDADDEGCYDVINTLYADVYINLIGTNFLNQTAESSAFGITSYGALCIDSASCGTLSIKSSGDGIYGDEITVAGGTVNVDAAYTGIYADNSLVVTAGELNVKAGRDGIEVYDTMDVYTAVKVEVVSAANGEYEGEYSALDVPLGGLYVECPPNVGVYAAYEVEDFDYDEYKHDEADSYDYVLIANPRPFVLRNFGSNRYETAFKAAQLMHADTGDFKAVVVTSGENFADALAGSYLASVAHAPILLTDNDNMDDVLEFIAAYATDDATVYALGGATIVSDELAAVESAGMTFKRLAGPSRFETNLAILDEAFTVAGGATWECVVCTGYNFADSLSASAVGLPILLVDDVLTEEQVTFLQDWAPEEFVLAGGTGAVSSAVENQLWHLYDELDGEYYVWVDRLAGANRFETSALVAEYFFDTPVMAVAAYGYNFPDGLCAGPLARMIGAPLLLAADGDEVYAASYTEHNGVTMGVAMGGAPLISDETLVKIFNLRSVEDVLTEITAP